MDKRIMELRIKQWITIIEEQGKSGLNKAEWCTLHGVDRTTFSGGRSGSGHTSLINGKTSLHSSRHPPRQMKRVLLRFLPHKFPLWKWQNRQTSVPGNKQPVPVLLP